MIGSECKARAPSTSWTKCQFWRHFWCPIKKMWSRIQSGKLLRQLPADLVAFFLLLEAMRGALSSCSCCCRQCSEIGKTDEAREKRARGGVFCTRDRIEQNLNSLGQQIFHACCHYKVWSTLMSWGKHHKSPLNHASYHHHQHPQFTCQLSNSSILQFVLLKSFEVNYLTPSIGSGIYNIFNFD